VLIENEFRATAPVEDLWSFLLDVERIAPCMPGAELTETLDERTWKGRVSMRFGPVTMSFAGTVTMQERDDDAHRVVLAAKGTEQKGKGAASATVTSWLEPNDDGTSIVKMRADISLTGAAAQLSRGLLPEVSKKLTQQFADCLKKNLSADHAAAVAPSEAAASASGGAAPEGAVASPAADGGPGGLPPDPAPTPPAGPGPAPASSAPPARAAEVRGLSLLVSALFGALKRAVGRLRGRSGHR
jgi:carbon monoxide dehydrogenase subunit G